MKRCWANSLGECSDKMSREHLVSECFFTSDTVTVMGHNWCKDKPVTIGLSSLTAKVLCKKHNEELSCLDAEAGRAFNVFRECDMLYNSRLHLKSRYWNIKRYRINGNRLERWFLKTTINMQVLRTDPIGHASTEGGVPSEELVKMVFNKAPFPDNCGLFNIIKLGEQVRTSETLEFSPLLKDQRFVGGALFRIRGLRFLIFFTPGGPPNPLTALGLPNEDWGDSQLNYHNKEIGFTINDLTSHTIEFIWR